MKTIEKAAEQHAEQYSDDPHYIGYDAFKAGVAFAQRWIPVEEELPEPEKCNASENVLIKLDTGYTAVAFYDSDIEEWYVIHPLTKIRNSYITHWRQIELK